MPAHETTNGQNVYAIPVGLGVVFLLAISLTLTYVGIR